MSNSKHVANVTGSLTRQQYTWTCRPRVKSRASAGL